MIITRDSRIKFCLLNGDVVVVEEVFTISDLKNYYPREYIRSRSDEQVFINLCLHVWSSRYQGWIVATFQVE